MDLEQKNFISTQQRLENHISKCRVCFGEDSGLVKITEQIEARFEDLLKIKLKLTSEYSDLICLECEESLEKFNNFKASAIENQLQLYKSYPCEVEVKLEILDVKQEYFEDFDDQDEVQDTFASNIEMLRESLSDSQFKSGKRKKRGRPGSENTKERKLCPDCGKYVMELTRHWRRTHSKIINFICDLCGYGSLLKHRLVKHMINRHTDRKLRPKFQCKFCEFTSVDKSYLRTHEKGHNVSKGEFRCHCGKEFLNKHVLAQHILMTHEKKYKFKCKFCPKSYPTSGTLREHETTKHTKKDLRDIICEICTKSFITETQLKAHVLEIHTEGHLSCSHEGCDKKFHKASKLNRHMLSHTKLKNFHCDQCPASYSHATHLYRHQEAVHLGIRFQCEVPGCSTDFRRRDNYRVHLMKSHKNMDSGFIAMLVKKLRETKS